MADQPYSHTVRPRKVPPHQTHLAANKSREIEFDVRDCVPAHGAVFGAEDGAAVGLAQQLDVLQAEEEAVGGGAGEDERLGRRLGLLLTRR